MFLIESLFCLFFSRRHLTGVSPDVVTGQAEGGGQEWRLGMGAHDWVSDDCSQ